jgi:hypothetical protein
MLHLMFADMVIDLGTPGRNAGPPLRWFADWLPDADRTTLDRRQLDRINAFSCSGPSLELHELLATVLPLSRPVWFEALITPEGGGEEIMMGFGAVPMDNGIDIGWVGHLPSLDAIIGPFGPVLVTIAGMDRPPGLDDDEDWLQLRSAAAFIIRALLIRSGPA